MPTMTGRVSAKQGLLDKIKKEKRMVESLVILFSKIDWDNLTKREVEALWSLFTDVKFYNL